MDVLESQLSQGCISFNEVPSRYSCDYQCVNINKDRQGCNAKIGMREDSYISLSAQECFEEKGVILHELVHVIGAIHEQNRPDRNQYVDVLEDLVSDGIVTNDRLPTRSSNYGNTFKTVYDFFSIMHYPKGKGCIGKSECIKVKEPYRKKNLSAADIVEISSAYNCTIRPQVMWEYLEYEKLIQSSENKGLKSTTPKEVSTTKPVRKPAGSNTLSSSTARSTVTRTTNPTRKTSLVSNSNECQGYKILDENVRSTQYFNDLKTQEEGYCDHVKPSHTSKSQKWRGKSWYRFQTPAGTRLAQFPPGSSRCGGYSAGWSNSTIPGKAGESVDIDICFDSSPDAGNANDCRISTRGKMTNCGTYFVYYLDNVPSCRANYCASF